MENATRIYDRTLIAVQRRELQCRADMVKESNDLFYQSRERKCSPLPTLRKQGGDVNTAHYYGAGGGLLNEMTKALMHITRPAFEHIDNNHEGLSDGADARPHVSINDDVETIYRRIKSRCRRGRLLGDRDEADDAATSSSSRSPKPSSELTRINEARSNTKASMLYLTIP